MTMQTSTCNEAPTYCCHPENELHRGVVLDEVAAFMPKVGHVGRVARVQSWGEVMTGRARVTSNDVPDGERL